MESHGPLKSDNVLHFLTSSIARLPEMKSFWTSTTMRAHWGRTIWRGTTKSVANGGGNWNIKEKNMEVTRSLFHFSLSVIWKGIIVWYTVQSIKGNDQGLWTNTKPSKHLLWTTGRGILHGALDCTFHTPLKAFSAKWRLMLSLKVSDGKVVNRCE